jgi:hypothetical protein
MFSMDRNRSRLLSSAVVGLFLLTAVGSPIRAQTAFSNVVLFAALSISELDTSTCPANVKGCLKNFLEKIPADSPLRRWEPPTELEKVIEARRNNLEMLMVVILGDKSRTEAQQFSKAVPLGLEWEGMWEGPLDEADFVLQWLQHYGETEIAPFLHLFMAHRLRAAWEAAVSEGGNKGLIPILAKRYKEQIAIALASTNPLIVCIAKDLEEQPYVYLSKVGRP